MLIPRWVAHSSIHSLSDHIECCHDILPSDTAFWGGVAEEGVHSVPVLVIKWHSRGASWLHVLNHVNEEVLKLVFIEMVVIVRVGPTESFCHLLLSFVMISKLLYFQGRFFFFGEWVNPCNSSNDNRVQIGGYGIQRFFLLDKPLLLLDSSVNERPPLLKFLNALIQIGLSEVGSSYGADILLFLFSFFSVAAAKNLTEILGVDAKGHLVFWLVHR